MKASERRKFILAGNPNVGKSTLFNYLTGSHQHTGNWTGKTVEGASGNFMLSGEECLLLDTPGIYSLEPRSPEEAITRDLLLNTEAEAIIFVCDVCSLEGSIFPALQLLAEGRQMLLCLNLLDEAEKRGCTPDTAALQKALGVPVAAISAATGRGVEEMLDTLAVFPDMKAKAPPRNTEALRHMAKELSDLTLGTGFRQKPRRLDTVLCHPFLAWPIMLSLLFVLLWLSISGAQLPSELLNRGLLALEKPLTLFFTALELPELFISALVQGVYRCSAWVVSVMLPPMTIFFPLFGLLEEWGLLPRLAFNMDPLLKKCGGCGQQALCMSMGLGCNAVGVTGCRIIASRREKLIAMLTNSFIPCNGRFPGLIILCGLLFPGSLTSAAALLCFIILAAVLSLAASKLLSLYIKGDSRGFILELPQYRRPPVLRSLFSALKEKVPAVLLRALKASAPAGLLIWLLGNIAPGGTPLLTRLSDMLDPAAAFIGLDGALLLGFILGLPANEIVLPVALMCYLSGGSLGALPPAGELGELLLAQGWSSTSIICAAVFSLCHWPCATTLQTIKKESGSFKLTLLAAALPTAFGVVLCSAINWIGN